MPRLTSLPDRLRYLQLFRRKFASRPDDLNEETGEAPLFALLGKRIGKLALTDAQELLAEDLAALEAWLSLPENINDCLQFVRGFLLVSPAELARRIQEEMAAAATPPPWVEVDLPEKASVRRIENRNEAAIIVRWKGLIISFQAMSEELAEKLTDAEWEQRPRSVVTKLSVRFGGVAGTKFIRMNDFVELFGTRQKEIGYLLRAPGGLISILIAPIGKKVNKETWSERELEERFPSLRVVEDRQDA